MHPASSTSHTSQYGKEHTHSWLHAALAAFASGTLWPSGVLGMTAFAAAVWLLVSGQGGPAAARWQAAETAAIAAEAEDSGTPAVTESEPSEPEAAPSIELASGWEEKPRRQDEDADENAELSEHELVSVASAEEVAAYISRSYRVPIADARQLTSWALEVGAGFDVDPLLLLAIAGTESSFNPKAKNGSGAEGLMQIMTRVHKEKFAAFGGASAALEPYPNMVVGASILSGLISRTGSVQTALKWYYGAANKNSDNGYAARVLSERSRLQVAASGDSRRAVELSRKGVSEPSSSSAGRVKNLGFGEWHTMVEAHAEKRGTAKLLSPETPQPQSQSQSQSQPQQTPDAPDALDTSEASDTPEPQTKAAADPLPPLPSTDAAAGKAHDEPAEAEKAPESTELPEALSSEVDLSIRSVNAAKASEVTKASEAAAAQN